MNSREKAMIYFTLPVSALLAWSIMARNMRKDQERGGAAVLEMEERVRLMQEAVAAVPVPEKEQEPVAKAEEAKAEPRLDSSLHLFREITEQHAFAGLRILSSEKISETSFRISVKGDFTAMVRWLTFLERPNGKFAVGTASLSPVPADINTGSTRELTGNFEVKLKG